MFGYVHMYFREKKVGHDFFLTGLIMSKRSVSEKCLSVILFVHHEKQLSYFD